MKKIIRNIKPKEIDIDKIENYKNLYNQSHQIIPRWNYGSNINLKHELLKMSENECVYCGTKINIKNFDVEHFLPKTKFPYLAYSYPNLLASCKRCNQNLKKSKYPKSLDNIKGELGEENLINNIENINIIKYDKKELFDFTKDRIIDPSFDNPEIHIKFNPETCEYTVLNDSSIGLETKNMFFRENKEYTEDLNLLSSQIMNMILEKNNKATILNISKITGNSYHIEKLYEYWIDILG